MLRTTTIDEEESSYGSTENHHWRICAADDCCIRAKQDERARHEEDFSLYKFLPSLCLIVALIFATQSYLVFSVSMLLIGYQVLAIYRGVSTHSLHWEGELLDTLAQALGRRV